MQTVLQALDNLIEGLGLIAVPILIIAVIVAGFNMASSDGGRQEKAKRQLIGVAIASVIIYGARFIVTTLISFVPA